MTYRRFAAGLFAAVWMVGCSSGGSNAECEVSADCPSGELCTDGQCAPICITTKDCSQGQVCTLQGFCVSDTRDRDGDGFAAEIDCDDTKRNVNPEAQEVPYDGSDNDCSPSTPDDDIDGDGWPNAFDCNDDLEEVHPQADEICDGLDNDCNEVIDDNPVTADTWYADTDSDGYGSDAITRRACAQPEGFVAEGGDCNDARADVHPEHPEVPGDEVANDCGDTDTALRVFITQRGGDNGKLTPLQRTSQQMEPIWHAEPDSLLQLTDVARSGSGTLYVADAKTGVYRWPSDDTPQQLAPASVDGLFYDHHQNSLLAAALGDADAAARVLEIHTDAVGDQSITEVASGLAADPAHAVRMLRRSGESSRTYVLFSHPAKLALWDSRRGTLRDVAYFPEPVVRAVPTRNGKMFVASQSGTIYRVAPWSGRIERVFSVPLPGPLNGLCPDVRGDDLLFTGSNALGTAIELYGTGNYASTLISESLQDIHGCTTNVLPDMDNDGYINRTLGGNDCRDDNRSIHPGVAEDPGGDGLDQNCDGLEGTDADGDGNASVATGGTDCNDTDPTEFYASNRITEDSACDVPRPRSCKEILEIFPRARSREYFIYPDGTAASEQFVYCEMGLAGGGWTLAANRGAGTDDNSESCFDVVEKQNLGTFFGEGCGSASSVGPNDSYAMSRDQRTKLDFSEYLVVQYKAGSLAVEDGFIIELKNSSQDLFPASTGTETEINLERACDIFRHVSQGDSACIEDPTWRYAATGTLQASCSGYTDNNLGGEYGLCASESNALGDAFNPQRAGENESKAWGRSSGNASDYHERIFVR